MPHSTSHGSGGERRRQDVRGVRPGLVILASFALVCAAALHPDTARAAVATQIATSWNHVCAIDAGGGVWCWGFNLRGQLGNGTTTDSTLPVAVTGLASGVAAVSAGVNETCAVTTSGGVKCWGWNGQGQLGDGTTVDSSTPVDVVGLASGVARVAVGSSHACALTVAGAVKCWGAAGRGQLGNGTNTASSTPVDVIGLASGATWITAGGGWSCAVASGGAVKCWGEGLYGELGTGVAGDSNVPVDVVGLGSGVAEVEASRFGTTCALTTAGGVACWGNTGFGTGSVPIAAAGLASGVASISAGGPGGALVLTTSGAVKSLAVPGGAPAVASDVNGLGSGMVAVAAGDASCALTAAGEIKCWGGGNLGEGPENEYSGTRGLPGCVAGFGDSDLDRICDAADACTAGAAFAHAPRPRLTVDRIHLDPVAGDDQLAFRARFSLPPARSFGDLDPIAEGARLLLHDPGGVSADRPFAPGAYAGPGTAGWLNTAGRKWTFLDSTGPGGKQRTRVVLVDKGAGLPGGAVDVIVSIKYDTIPVSASDTPFSVTFVPGGPAAGSAGECSQTDLDTGECTFNARGTRLTCRLQN